MNVFGGRNLVVLILFLFNLKCGLAAMTEKQVAAASKLVKNMCQPKTKATQEDIDKMHQGDWNIDHTAMCYMYCASNQYKLLTKENRLDRAAAEAQIKVLPESLKEYVVRCLNRCQDAAVTLEDKCVAAYEIAKCMYECDPEKYFLP